MKPLRLLPASFSLVFVSAVLAACSSDPDVPAAVAETGTDSGKAETPADTKPETKPPLEVGVCDKALDPTFACVPATKTAGGAVCTETDIQDQLKACWKPLGGDTTKCAAWAKDHGGCQKCIGTWTYKNGNPNRDACYYRVMTPTCANAVSCYFDCIGQVCAECASDPTEYLDCQKRARVAGGGCYANSYKTTETEKCFDGAGAIDPCVVDELTKSSPDATMLAEQLAIFYRGACRDNGDWTNAKSATGGDAGADATATDSASDGATDAASDGG